MPQEITGKHVLVGMVLGFGVIIAVNLTLAYNAVRTFPGLEVKNSYIASQNFDHARNAQEKLNWTVDAVLVDGILELRIRQDNVSVNPKIISAVFGRATNVKDDQTPEFSFNGDALVAPVNAGKGNWNLRLKAEAKDGTIFQQRIIVRHAS